MYVCISHDVLVLGSSQLWVAQEGEEDGEKGEEGEEKSGFEMT